MNSGILAFPEFLQYGIPSEFDFNDEHSANTEIQYEKSNFHILIVIDL